MGHKHGVQHARQHAAGGTRFAAVRGESGPKKIEVAKASTSFGKSEA